VVSATTLQVGQFNPTTQSEVPPFQLLKDTGCSWKGLETKVVRSSISAQECAEQRSVYFKMSEKHIVLRFTNFSSVALRDI